MDISEGLKKVFLAGVGAIATTADAAKDLVDTLVKKGEITVEQGRVLNEELKRSAKEKMNDHVTVNIIKEYKDVMSAVDHMPKEERDVLKEKLAALEKEEAEKRAAQAAKDAQDESDGDAGDEDRNCESGLDGADNQESADSDEDSADA
ncbi:phasin family protein [Diplocloster agilis]|uniref:phasin family protein n=1 Tax=Diplocloster agilis TaxID=2850323 RepID=UPI0008232B5A|nr:hypothetical protein [Suonthocola fibrivorans]MCU6735303.1 hypothetical protein [Suonthocola fibrivorans]SCJ70087.1 Uncharacterized conserved protein [uncultured Clostridium sp.]